MRKSWPSEGKERIVQAKRKKVEKRNRINILAMLPGLPLSQQFFLRSASVRDIVGTLDPGVSNLSTFVQLTADVVSLRFSGSEFHYLRIFKNCKHLGWDLILGLYYTLQDIQNYWPLSSKCWQQCPNTCGNHPSPPIHTLPLPDVSQMERK